MLRKVLIILGLILFTFVFSIIMALIGMAVGGDFFVNLVLGYFWFVVIFSTECQKLLLFPTGEQGVELARRRKEKYKKS